MNDIIKKKWGPVVFQVNLQGWFKEHQDRKLQNGWITIKATNIRR